jgi:2,5-diketo-D-gluconate reductase A
VIPTVRLNNGVEMPQLGLGTGGGDDEASRARVLQALEIGYRLFDTAASYGNEAGVGHGVADSGIPRAEIFVCTKLRGADHGYESTKRALAASLHRLGLEYVDLYLIHWPLPRQDKYAESWRAMAELLAEGRIRAIGVSNFLAEHLDRLAAESSVVPAVNQLEVHPRHPQLEQRADDERRGIVTQAWSPLSRGGLLDDPTLAAIAERHGRTPAQIVLRWHVQQGLTVIPKASHIDRMRQNADVFGFDLTGDDLTEIAGLADGGQGSGLDPRSYQEF